MKHRDLIKAVEANGYYLLRHGINHDVYTDGTRIEPIPRHREVNEQLAKAIIKRTSKKG